MQETVEIHFTRLPSFDEAVPSLFFAWVVGMILILSGGYMRRQVSSIRKTAIGGIIGGAGLVCCFLVGVVVIRYESHHEYEFDIFIWPLYFVLFFIAGKKLWRSTER